MQGVYDGSFEGFLTLVHEVYYKKLSFSSIQKELPSGLFLDDFYLIKTDETKALAVLEALKKRFEKHHFESILVIFMCDRTSFEISLLEFIVLGFKDQKELQNINQTSVFTIQNLQRHYFRNYHKMSGFLRFRELEDGSLYAQLQNQFNLLYYLGKHFLKRFNNQTFFIHDVERSLVFIKNDTTRGVFEVKEFDLPNFSENEEKFQKLWKHFNESITIESRINEKLQKQLVPLIYRTYMNEFLN